MAAGGRVSAVDTKPSLVHPSAIVYPSVTLGAGSVVEPYVVLGSPSGPPLEIGPGAVIRSGTRIYGGVTVGSGFKTGHNVLVRGNVVAGDDFHIGSYSSVEGTVSIGDGVVIQGRCEVADSTLEDGCRIWVGTYVCDNPWPPDGPKRPPVIGKGAKVFAGVIVMPGSLIEENAVVAAGAVVSGVVPPGMIFLRDGSTVPRRDL